MVGRLVTAFLAALVVAALPAGIVIGSENGNDVGVMREEDLWVAASEEDDDDDVGPAGGTNTNGTNTNGTNSFTSGVDSNDNTNSRVTPVSKDRDRSRGDLTKDRTKDGPGGSKRDWTKNKTNDKSRNDSRK